MRKIAILGSTGSIGTQTLEVVEANPERFSVEVLTANNHVDLLIEQALKFHPDSVVIANEEKYPLLRDALQHEDIKVFAGADALDFCRRRSGGDSFSRIQRFNPDGKCH